MKTSTIKSNAAITTDANSELLVEDAGVTPATSKRSMKMNIENVIRGFEEFYNVNALPSLRDWGDSTPVLFKNTALFDSLQLVSEYGINQVCKLDELNVDDEGNPVVPKALQEAVGSLYRFWHKCTMYCDRDQQLSEYQIVASHFVLMLHTRLRIDFGLDFSLERPLNGTCYFTYSDICHLTNYSRGSIRNKAKELDVEKCKAIPKNLYFTDINPLCNHPALDNFYINVPQHLNQTSMISHFDAMRFLSTMKDYKPSRFSVEKSGIETIVNLHDTVLCASKIISLLKRLPRSRGESAISEAINIEAIDNEFFINIKIKAKAKLTLPMLTKIDKAFSSIMNIDGYYIPFQTITP